MRTTPGSTSVDYEYLFVVTYGRSGSTLLQGILNSIPGYLIRGENRQVLRHLFEIHRTMSRERRKHEQWLRRHEAGDALAPTHAFFGADGFPLRKSHKSARRYALATLLRPGDDTRVTGFKEIRWNDEDVADFVKWMRRVFPGARFVFNTRDLGEVVQSAWWADDPDATTHLAAVEDRLLALAADLGDDAYRVHYNDYVNDPKQLTGLFEWLDEPFDEERVRQVMETRHSWPYRPGAGTAPVGETGA